MRTFLVASVLSVVCLVSAVSVSAQSIVLPKVISFAGVPGYSGPELLAFTGLKPGGTSTPADLQAAAQRLNDTGLFAEVRFQSTGQGLVYTLKPMPADNLLPAQFRNLVFWSPGELDTALRARVALYRGSVPLAGNMQDKICAALTAMLAEKGVTANVAAIPQVAQAGATPSAMAFAIDSPSVVMHSLVFEAASPAMQAKLEKVARSVIDQPFDEGTTRSSIAAQVIEIYRNEGYLDIAVRDISYTSPAKTAKGISLDLTAKLHEGEPYRLAQLTWQGSDIMSAAEFSRLVKIKPEDIASQLALRQSLAPLAAAYYAKGYQDAKVQAPAALDAATHHVAYTVRVIPGEQYRIKSVKAVGLTETQRQQFDSAWRMRAGDFYDIHYLNEFLKQNSSLQSLRGYSATWRAVSDPDTHLVDLTVSFVKGGTLINVD